MLHINGRSLHSDRAQLAEVGRTPGMRGRARVVDPWQTARVWLVVHWEMLGAKGRWWRLSEIRQCLCGILFGVALAFSELDNRVSSSSDHKKNPEGIEKTGEI